MSNAAACAPLAVSSPQRLAALPEVPTLAESGCPGFEAGQWCGLPIPRRTEVVKAGNAKLE